MIHGNLINIKVLSVNLILCDKTAGDHGIQLPFHLHSKCEYFMSYCSIPYEECKDMYHYVVVLKMFA